MHAAAALFSPVARRVLEHGARLSTRCRWGQVSPHSTQAVTQASHTRIWVRSAGALVQPSLTRSPAITASAVDGQSVFVEWSDGVSHHFHPKWLRHNCACPDCLQQQSGQKTVLLADIADFTLDNASAYAIGEQVVVDAESHTLALRSDFLRSAVITRNEAIAESRTKQAKKAEEAEEAEVHPSAKPLMFNIPLPRANDEGKVPALFHDYNDIMQFRTNGEARFKWLKAMGDFGYAVVQNAHHEDAVTQLANAISQPQPTIYGQSFDVVSVEDPINIAYTNVHLTLHQDLAYYESPPGLQFLHAYPNDDCVDGGESLLVDVFHAAEILRAESPHHFNTLTAVPLRFQKIHYKRATPVHMVKSTPVIVTEDHRRMPIGACEASNSRVVGVTWAPPFEGALDTRHLSFNEVDAFYEAYAAFGKLIHASADAMFKGTARGNGHVQEESATTLTTDARVLTANKGQHHAHLPAATARLSGLVKYRLRTGDVLTFNNRRILHGRTSFTLNGGQRILHGVYVNIDEFASALNYECHTRGLVDPPLYLGNGQINHL